MPHPSPTAVAGVSCFISTSYSGWYPKVLKYFSVCFFAVLLILVATEEPTLPAMYTNICTLWCELLKPRDILADFPFLCQRDGLQRFHRISVDNNLTASSGIEAPNTGKITQIFGEPPYNIYIEFDAKSFGNWTEHLKKSVDQLQQRYLQEVIDLGSIGCISSSS